MKFKNGDWVRVTHPTQGTWEGEVYRVGFCGEAGIEYWVTNAPEIAPMIPLLAWEHEMKLAPEPRD